MSLSADFILSTPLDSPERVFQSETADGVESKIRELLKEWHPDVSKRSRATEVTSHLNVLADAARKRVGSGTWSRVGVQVWRGSDGRERRLRYKKRSSFELGTLFYGDDTAAYETRPEHEKLYSNALTRIATLHFEDEKMKREMERFLPLSRKSFTSDRSLRVLAVSKPRETYTARDVVEAVGGKLSPEHAAWVMSALLNVCCYLQWARISHGDVSLDSVFLTPSDHAASLLGGWWYAAPVGTSLTHLPSRTASLAPRDSISMKRADERTDLLCARALVREALGDPTGTNPSRETPRAMSDFLRSPSSGSALEDYTTWRNSVLPASFGDRRFVELSVHDSDVFK